LFTVGKKGAKKRDPNKCPEESKDIREPWEPISLIKGETLGGKKEARNQLRTL